MKLWSPFGQDKESKRRMRNLVNFSASEIMKLFANQPSAEHKFRDLVERIHGSFTAECADATEKALRKIRQSGSNIKPYKENGVVWIADKTNQPKRTQRKHDILTAIHEGIGQTIQDIIPQTPNPETASGIRVKVSTSRAKKKEMPLVA